MKKFDSAVMYLATHSKLKLAIGIMAFALLAAIVLVVGDGQLMEMGRPQSWPPPVAW